MMTKRDALYKCTTRKFWVCEVRDRILVSKKGRCAWTCKSAAALAFLNSNYWRFVSRNLTKEQEKNTYKELLSSGEVKYIEITQVPKEIHI